MDSKITNQLKEIIQNFEGNKDKRISWDDYFASLAMLSSMRSSCNRLKVGCVLVKNNRVIGMGYNGFLPGADHVSIVVNNHEQATVHAEQNAISDAANRGVSVNDSIAYITHFPCINCFKILVASGIKKIKYLSDYKNDDVVNKLIDSGANIDIEKLG